MKLFFVGLFYFSSILLMAQTSSVEHLLPLDDKAFCHFTETVPAASAPMEKAPIQWNSYPKAKKYRTRITKGYSDAEARNFAGRFIIPSNIGCSGVSS